MEVVEQITVKIIFKHNPALAVAHDVAFDDINILYIVCTLSCIILCHVQPILLKCVMYNMT